jgi:hypothetical protein
VRFYFGSLVFSCIFCYGSCTALYTLLPSVPAQDPEAAKIVRYLHCPQIANLNKLRDGTRLCLRVSTTLMDRATNNLLIRLRSSHLAFTIPPAIILTVILRPLLTRLDLYKICFLVTVSTCFCPSAHSPTLIQFRLL